MNFDEITRKIKFKHLYYLLIFLSALVIRTVAVARLTATNTEAEIFINLVHSSGEAGQSGSILFQLLTKPLLAMFGNSNLTLRWWAILAGACITLLPLLYANILGERTALILAFLLALDPFQVANGMLADGNALTMLTLYAALGFFQRKRYGLGTISFVAFLFSGLHIQYGLVLLLLIAAVAGMFELGKKVVGFLKDILQYNREKLATLAITAFLVILLFPIMNISFSDGFSQFFHGFQNWQKPYVVGEYPQLFLLALLSYLPIFLVCVFPIGKLPVKREMTAALYLGLLVMLIAVAIYPGHAVIDLVWASLPICVLSAMKINHMIENYQGYSKKIQIPTILLMVLTISLVIHFGLLVYRMQYGINWAAEGLSIIILIVLFVMVTMFITYNESVGLAMSAAGIDFLIVLLVIQLAFTWRATGLNGNPAAEILWGGYYEGDQMVDEIIDNADLKVLDTGLVNEVAFLDYDNAAVEWAVGQKYPTVTRNINLGGEPYAVIFTESSTGLESIAADDYYGQKFIAASVPSWTWRPIKSLVSSEFWSWLLWRQNEQIPVYHYVWLNKNLFH